MRSLFVGIFILFQGCGLTPLTMDTRFDRIGAMGKKSRIRQKLKKPSQVKVFYGSIPKGFFLRRDNLIAKRKYGHKVVGKIKILGSGYGNRSSKMAVIKQLKEQAFNEGANAVVYAQSSIGETPGLGEVQRIKDKTGEFGSGWAVVLKL